MADNPTILQRWQSLPPKKRTAYSFGGGAVLLVIAVFMLAPDQPQVVAKGPNKGLQQTNLGLPGSDGRDLTLEKLSASIEAVTKDGRATQQELKQTQKVLVETQRQANQNQGLSPEAVKEMEKLRAELKELKAKQEQTPSLDDALPGGSGPITETQVEIPVQPEPPRIRIIGDARAPDPKDAEEEKPKQTVFLPAGSNFEGVLLNGMDAPTSGVAQKTPVPALVRLKTDAILPNRYRYDVRECFMIVSGFGVLSTERAQLQTVVMSCVKNDGSVIETKVEGYVVGEDGKVGLRGRLVSKQGQMLAKSFASGFLSGIGTAMAPTAVTPLNTTPSSTTQYQTPNLSAVASAGTAQGIAQSARMLSQFYLDIAKEMFPVVEIDANRRVTIILLKGFELNMIGAK